MKAGKEKTVTQTDIARELNISVVSVSNALSGKKGVSDELRQLVLDMAEEMGYQGDIRLTKMREISVRIGVVVSERYLYDTPSFYMNVYQEIVVAAANQNSVTFLEVLSIEAEENLQMPDLIKNGQADGILVLGEMTRSFTREMREKCRVPVIFVDYYEDLPDTDFIISDGYTGMCQLTRMLLDAGYQKIGFVGNNRATSSIMDRYLGYRKALMERGIQIRPDWVIPDREDWSHNLFVELPEELPEAFVCSCDKTASILIRRLRESGYQVPEDIGVVGFDHFLMENIEGLQLATYDVDIEEMARFSVNTLRRKINGTSFTSRLRVLQGKVQDGTSYLKKR